MYCTIEVSLVNISRNNMFSGQTNNSYERVSLFKHFFWKKKGVQVLKVAKNPSERRPRKLNFTLNVDLKVLIS